MKLPMPGNTFFLIMVEIDTSRSGLSCRPAGRAGGAGAGAETVEDEGVIRKLSRRARVA